MNRPDIRRLPKRANPQEALAKLLDAESSRTLLTEEVGLAKALGRVLAKDTYSNINIPGYDKTFIDGYAINPKDTVGASTLKPAVFKVVGKLFPADIPNEAQVARGEAMYVACGAPIPKGIASTIKVEETRLDGDRIEVLREIKPGEGIIPLGDDVKQGALLLNRGQIVRPQDIGLLASIGMSETEVFKKPTIAILSGGDELIKEHKKDPTKIVNNYALVIAGLASELGSTATLNGIMRDTLDQVQTKIGEALLESDIVVTIGGTSVGIKDFVPDAINNLGPPGVVVQGVSLRPGAVSGFGIVNGKPVVMLPGHIGSCIAGFYLFAAPLIRLYCGLEGDGLLPCLTAELSEEVDSGPQFRFLFLRLKRAEGKLLADQVEGGSSALTTIVKSNGYSIIPPHTSLAKGTKVEVHLFGKLELSQIT
ncbi:MAG: molybdopterin molybdotransferase MoeA [Candidatus Bathyarchaeia archaeon]|jgi:molybdenum cofactor synthesis domain-containing protein